MLCVVDIISIVSIFQVPEDISVLCNGFVYE